MPGGWKNNAGLKLDCDIVGRLKKYTTVKIPSFGWIGQIIWQAGKVK